MARQYMIANGADPTTAALLKVTTGTAIKTLLQVQANSAIPFIVFEWGISLDGSSANTAINCELIDTESIPATVTAHVIAGVMPYGPDQTASTVALGTTATGYTATAEGTTTASRYGDAQLIAPTNQYVKEFSLGREFYVPAGHNCRIRVTNPGTAVNAYCYMKIEEV
jgi:hypothetical protein